MEVRNLPVLKNRERPLVTKYVLRYGPGEYRFVKIVQDYLNTKHQDQYAFQFTRQAAYWNIRKHTNLFPHLLRSLRATKDVVTYNLDAIDLKRKHVWSTYSSAERVERNRSKRNTT